MTTDEEGALLPGRCAPPMAPPFRCVPVSSELGLDSQEGCGLATEHTHTKRKARPQNRANVGNGTWTTRGTPHGERSSTAAHYGTGMSAHGGPGPATETASGVNTRALHHSSPTTYDPPPGTVLARFWRRALHLWMASRPSSTVVRGASHVHAEERTMPLWIYVCTRCW